MSDDMGAISGVIDEFDGSVAMNLVHEVPARIGNDGVDALGRYWKISLDGFDKLIGSFTCVGRDQVRLWEGRAQGHDGIIAKTINLVKDENLRNITGPNPLQHPAYCVDLA